MVSGVTISTISVSLPSFSSWKPKQYDDAVSIAPRCDTNGMNLFRCLFHHFASHMWKAAKSCINKYKEPIDWSLMQCLMPPFGYLLSRAIIIHRIFPFSVVSALISVFLFFLLFCTANLALQKESQRFVAKISSFSIFRGAYSAVGSPGHPILLRLVVWGDLFHSHIRRAPLPSPIHPPFFSIPGRPGSPEARSMRQPPAATMGCAASNEAVSVTPAVDSAGILRDQRASSRKHRSGRSSRRGYCGSKEEEDRIELEEHGKASEDCARLQKFRLGNLHSYIEGEQVAAGWPSWLSAVAGEAIQGWVPLKADSFEKLEKVTQKLRVFLHLCFSVFGRQPLSQ